VTPRHTSLALVLALLAGLLASSCPMVPVIGQEAETVEDVGGISQTRRFLRKLNGSQRDHRRASHEESLALPEQAFSLRGAELVAIVETIAPADVRDEQPEPIALARGPPHVA
jgi:hypothetical protein